jgi:toxin ParE1/3/4
VVWDSLAQNPFLNSRRHPIKNVRWRFPERFPYHIIYEVIEAEETVVVAAVGMPPATTSIGSDGLDSLCR